ncbi:beta strand repeat-containing protein [Novosphingobium sp.]|uniref:beta strand repeat-containing protein n=1 Tax=Novosphingobium sp. TaxID=1874826 RepID=UPI0038B9E557
MATYADPANPATFITTVDHTPLITSYDLYQTDPAKALFTYATSAKYLTFSPNLTYSDIHLNNDGAGNLVVRVITPTGDDFSVTIAGFEQGTVINGYTLGTPPATQFDGLSEFTTSPTTNTPIVVPTSHGNYTFYDASPTLFTLRALMIDGRGYGLTNGVGINGTAGNDHLLGFGVRAFDGHVSNDTLRGGAGDDVLDGGAGVDWLDGGSGYDTAILDYSEQSAAVVAVNGSNATAGYQMKVGGVLADTLVAIEALNVTGGAGNDRIGGVYAMPTDGLAHAATLAGGGGTDTAVLDLSAATTISTGASGTVLASGAHGQVSIALNGIEAVDVTGSAGADTLDFHTLIADSTIRGGAGDDTITAGVGNDALLGGDGNDRLSGGAGNDTLGGGAGNDVLACGTGNNVLDGGVGTDSGSLDFSDRAGNLVLINGALPGQITVPTVGGVAAGSVRNVELLSIVGGSGGDRIGGVFSAPPAGAGGAVTLDGRAGNDTAVIDLAAASHIVVQGNSTVADFTSGATVTLTTAGIEHLDLTAGAGDDVLRLAGPGVSSGITGDSVVHAGNGNDVVVTGSGNDTLFGGGGSDVLAGGVGNNVLDGGAGYDAVAFDFSDRTGAVELINGAVSGAVYTATVGGVAAGSFTNAEVLSVTGGSGNDHIGGVYRPPTDGHTATATLNGNGGTDTAVLDLSSAASAVWDGASHLQINGDLGAIAMTLNGIKALDLTGTAGNDVLNFQTFAADSTIRGGAGDDRIGGGAGNDTLLGGDGNDVISGGGIRSGGIDVIDGGAGYDSALLDFSGATATVVGVLQKANASATSVVTVGGVSGSSLTNIEALSISSGSGNDRIGGSFAMPTDGVARTFTLNGGAGIDTAVIDLSYTGWPTASGLVWDAASASFIATTYDGQQITVALKSIEALDITVDGPAASLDFSAFTQAITYHAVGYGSNDSMVIGGSGNDVITGAFGYNTFYGGAGDDTLIGNAAGDKLYGGAGNDTLMGNNSTWVRIGADYIDGGDGIDTVLFSDGYRQPDASVGVTVDLAIKGLQHSDSGDGETLVNIENITGTRFRDTLSGAGDANTLDGRGGNDILDGRGGADILIGGSGSDVFRFTTMETSANADTIADFVHGSDHIQLSAAVFAPLPTGALDPAAFTLGTAATTAAQHVIFDTATSHLFFDADGSGAAATVLLATLTGVTTLTASDFLVI